MPPTPSRMMLTVTCSCGQPGDLVGERLERTGDVGLDDEVELLLAALRAREHVLERHAAGGLTSECRLLEPDAALVRDTARLALVLDDAEVLARRGHAVEAEDLDRHARRRLLHPLAPVVVHRAHAAHVLSGDDRVADLQAAAVDDQRDDGAAARIELRLDHEAGGVGVGVGLELLDLGERDQRLEQVVEVLPGLGRDVHELGVSAPVGRRQALLRELAAHAVGVGPFLVDLVDRDHDRHAGGLGVVDRLDGLRHDAVVGGHHDHGDVRDLGPAGAHGREGLVAGGVEEGDRVVVVMDLVGADVLRDAAGLAGRHLGLADRVEQRRLAVVDVPHDRDHGRAVDQLLVGVLEGGLGLGVLGRADHVDLLVEGLGEHRDRVVGQGLRERRHLAQLHQLLDHLGGAQLERLGDLLDGGARADLDGRVLALLRLEPRLRLSLEIGLDPLRAAPAAAPAAGRLGLRRRRGPVAPGRLRIDHHAASPAAATAVARLAATTTGRARAAAAATAGSAVGTGAA